MVIWKHYAQLSVSVCHLKGPVPTLPIWAQPLDDSEMRMTEDELTWHRAAHEENLT